MKNKFLQAAILAAITTVLTDFLLFYDSFIRLLLYVVVSFILFFLVIKIGFKIFLKKTKLTSKYLLLSFAAGIVNVFCEFLRIFVIRLYVPLLGYIITFAVFFVFTLIMYKHIEGDDSTNIETTTQEKEFSKNAKGLVAFVKKHWVVLSSIVVTVALIVAVPIIISNSYNKTLTVAVQEYLSGKTFVYRESNTKVYAYTFNDNTVGAESWSSVLHTTYGNLNDAKQYKATGSAGSDEIRLVYNDNGRWQLISTAVLHEDGTVEFPSDQWTSATVDEIDKLRRQTLCDHVFALETIIKNANGFEKGQSKRTCSRCWINEIYEFDFVEQHRPSLWDIKRNVIARTSLTDSDIVAKDGSKEVYEGFLLSLVVNDDQLILKNDRTSFTTISNSRGNIEKVYLMNSRGSFNESDWRDIMYYTFNMSDPLDLDSVSTFIARSQCTTKDNTTYYTYRYGGITYELMKYSPSGYCFTIYFEDTI